MEQLGEGSEKSATAHRLGKTSNQGTTNLAGSLHFFSPSGVPWAGFTAASSLEVDISVNSGSVRRNRLVWLWKWERVLLTLRGMGDPHFFSFSPFSCILVPGPSHGGRDGGRCLQNPETIRKRNLSL